MTIIAVLLGSSADVLGQKGEPTSSEHSPADVEAERAGLQEDFLKLRFGLFLHFNMATYVNREWASGYEDPAIFKPDRLNCRQWADVARAAGMKYGVLTVKHTGGWCLWDSNHTTHDISSFINYKNGKGDIVREFVDAFRAHGLKVGFYYCFPGDFSNTRHGSAVREGKPDLHGLPPEAAGDYVGFIKLQLSELLTGYGPVDGDPGTRQIITTEMSGDREQRP
jgi:alpha-L-fucosidase